ncbi:rod-determining factor RdfA [Haloarchaeobius amylolyticus]|uniref:rod-determining factor RdfA n=1 Tax=Haloarchaeobius amylolyticus TaxID=1198296 RepID=UPI00226EF3B8|nr:rod-determining factor RdfA [Haloarchaeobius amylolyticus]
MEEDTPTDAGGGGRGKVARLIAQYGLAPEVGEDMVEQWTAEGDQRTSLRDLADQFNRRLLRAALESDGEHVRDSQVESYYRRLRHADLTAGERVELEQELAGRGVDIDQLETDFVSYQSIRTFVKNRGAEYVQAGDEAQLARDAESIERLRSRLQSVTTDRLDRLDRTDRIELGEYSLLVDVQVFCEDCGTQFDVVDLLENGGCACDS